MTDKAAKRVTEKLKEQIIKIEHSGERKSIGANVNQYNLMVLGIHNYYRYATGISSDCSKIQFVINTVLYNRLRNVITKSGQSGLGFISKKTGVLRDLSEVSVENEEQPYEPENTAISNDFNGENELAENPYQEEFYCFYPDAFTPSPIQCMEGVKRAGITHICGSVIRRKKYEGGLDYIRDCNDRAYEIKKIIGDFYTPGIHVHPDFVKESIEEIELRHKQGFGLIGELVPYMHGWNDYSRNDLGNILEAAGHYRMPVSFHTVGSEQKETDKMIEEHPEVTFIAAHPGDKEQFLLLLERINKFENYYLDLSGTGIFRYGLISHGVREVGSERFLFGTDYPICNPRMYVQAVFIKNKEIIKKR